MLVVYYVNFGLTSSALFEIYKNRNATEETYSKFSTLEAEQVRLPFLQYTHAKAVNVTSPR